MSADLDSPFLAMVREWPLRSGITVFVPLLFAIGQLANSYYHGFSFVYPSVFTVVLLGMMVLTLEYQVAAFRSAQF